MAGKDSFRDLGSRLSKQSRVLNEVIAVTRVSAATHVHRSSSSITILMTGLRINFN